MLESCYTSLSHLPGFPLAAALSPHSVGPRGSLHPQGPSPPSLLTPLPAFAPTPVSDQEEDEEAEQQDEGHRGPDEDVQVPVGTLGTSHTMTEPAMPFHGAPAVCIHL